MCQGDLHILRPFDRREAITLRTAPGIAGRSESTLWPWCPKDFIAAVSPVGRGRLAGRHS